MNPDMGRFELPLEERRDPGYRQISQDYYALNALNFVHCPH